MSREWCTFFAAIEANPKEIIKPNLTIREMFEAKDHLNNCDVCYNRSLRVLEQDEKSNKIRGFISEN